MHEARVSYVESCSAFFSAGVITAVGAASLSAELARRTPRKETSKEYARFAAIMIGV